MKGMSQRGLHSALQLGRLLLGGRAGQGQLPPVLSGLRMKRVFPSQPDPLLPTLPEVSVPFLPLQGCSSRLWFHLPQIRLRGANRGWSQGCWLRIQLLDV